MKEPRSDEEAQRRARMIVVDAIERRSEAVEIALTADLAVGNDVEPGFFLAAYGDQGGVTLGFLEQRLRDPPKLPRAHARYAVSLERGTVDQPADGVLGE